MPHGRGASRVVKGKPKAKGKARRKTRGLSVGPSPAEERRFRAERMAMDAFRNSPEFAKAAKAAEGNLAKAEEAARKVIRGK